MRTRTGRTVHLGTLDMAAEPSEVRQLVHLLVCNADWTYKVGDQLSIESVVPRGAQTRDTPR